MNILNYTILFVLYLIASESIDFIIHIILTHKKGKYVPIRSGEGKVCIEANELPRSLSHVRLSISIVA